MDDILQSIGDAIHDFFVDVCGGMFIGIFDDANAATGDIASQVGLTPSQWNGSIFTMIQNLSKNVVIPIAGLIITFVLCYELITMIADKTKDIDYYVLALAAIARELNIRKITSGKVHIAAGLPLTWVSGQRNEFKDYLMQNREVEFTFRGTQYHVEIIGADVFPQGFAAVADRLSEFKGVNMLCDIGNGTMNIMFINDKKPIPGNMFTEKYGTHQCLLAVRENVMRIHHTTVDEAIINRVFRFGTADMPQKTLRIVSVTMFLPVQRKRSIKAKKPIVNTAKKNVFRRMKNVSENTRKNCEDLRRPPPRSRTRQEIPQRRMSRRRELTPVSSVIRQSKLRSVPNTPSSSLPVLRANRL